MTLEAKCRALVKKWREESGRIFAQGEHYAAGACTDHAAQLETILPKRRPKKRKEVARYGPPPSTLVERKRKRKAAQ